MKTAKFLNAGFTISELLVVMAIAVILWTLASITFIRPQEKVNLDSVVTTMVSDMKSQQTKAMSGEAASDYGIHFETHRYILFTGSTYNSLDSNNYEVKVDLPLQIINITLSTPNLIFQKGSGEVTVVVGQDGFTIQNSAGGASTNLVINKYGAINQN